MSPPRTTASSRGRRRTPYKPPRDRRELAVAICVPLVVVAFTVFAIWAMRPGGIAGRQPRATTWLVGVVVLLVVVGWYLTRRNRRLEGRATIAIGLTVVVVAVVAVPAALLWPGGLVRENAEPDVFDPADISVPPVDSTPVDSTTPPAT